LIVHSEERQQAANEQMDRRLLKSEKQLQKQLKKLKKEDFECEADALRAASTFAKELRYHKLTQSFAR
jgi:transposase